MLYPLSYGGLAPSQTVFRLVRSGITAAFSSSGVEPSSESGAVWAPLMRPSGVCCALHAPSKRPLRGYDFNLKLRRPCDRPRSVAHLEGVDVNDLIEFLLARIAEDEAEVLADQPFSIHRVEDPEGKYWWECTWCGEGGWSAVSSAPEWLQHGRAKGHPRLLRECEAKRQILEYTKTVLVRLALPYADHPDYRDEEWRPR